MKNIFLLFLLLSALFTIGCAPNDERGIKDSREEVMMQLKKSLSDNGIPYKVSDDGHVIYNKKYEEKISQIMKDLDKHRLSEIGSKFEDAEGIAYFRSLLDEKGIQYRKDGDWTYWRPENEQQQNELEMKVVRHSLEKKKNQN